MRDPEKQKTAQRKYREAHPGRCKLAQERWRAEPANKEKMRVKSRKWYRDNCVHARKKRRLYRIANPGKIRRLQRAWKDRLIEWRMDYKRRKGCIDCGENDPVVLDFDHKNGKRKKFSLAKTVSLSRMKQEAKKCDVRCANCHRRRTAKQLGWYKNWFRRSYK